MVGRIWAGGRRASFLQGLFLLALVFSPTADARIYDDCLRYLKVIGRSVIRSDSPLYQTKRGVLHYRHGLGPWFFEALRKLINDSHWIDGGSGEAVALRSYLTSSFWHWWLPGERARVTAVGIEQPRTRRTRRFILESDPEVFRYLHGKPIENRSLDVLGPADLITDFYGALSYGRQMDKTFETYGKILKPGGELLAVVELSRQEPIGSGKFGLFREIPALRMVDEQGSPVALEEYLKSIRGFTIETQVIPYFGGVSAIRIKAVRNGDPVFIPRLELVEMKSGTPPYRLYRILKN